MSFIHIAVFTGKLQEGFNVDAVQTSVMKQLRMNPYQAAQLFGGKPVIVKKTADQQLCEKTVERMVSLGLRCLHVSLPALPDGIHNGYKLAYFGKIAEGFRPPDVQQDAMRLLKLDPALVPKVFSGQKVAIRRSATAEQVARQLAELSLIGMPCQIEVERHIAQNHHAAIAAAVPSPSPHSPAAVSEAAASPEPDAPDPFAVLLDTSSLQSALASANSKPEAKPQQVAEPAFDPLATLVGQNNWSDEPVLTEELPTPATPQASESLPVFDPEATLFIPAAASEPTPEPERRESRVASSDELTAQITAIRERRRRPRASALQVTQSAADATPSSGAATPAQAAMADSEPSEAPPLSEHPVIAPKAVRRRSLIGRFFGLFGL